MRFRNFHGNLAAASFDHQQETSGNKCFNVVVIISLILIVLLLAYGLEKKEAKDDARDDDVDKKSP